LAREEGAGSATSGVAVASRCGWEHPRCASIVVPPRGPPAVAARSIFLDFGEHTGIRHERHL
jgi:hypothetical protein